MIIILCIGCLTNKYSTPLVQIGKQFDALLIDVKAPQSSFPVFDVFSEDTLDVRLIQ